MARLTKISAASCLALSALIACSEPDPAPSPPKAIRPVTPTTLSGTVGAKVEGGVTVHVVDYSDRSAVGVKVGFSVTSGDGSVDNRLVITDGEGHAHTEWTLGETAGLNEVTASIYGLDSTARFSATGNAGPAVGLAITPRILRIPSTNGGGNIVARLVDAFGNVVPGSPSYVTRDPAIVTVSSTGSVTVTNNNRGTNTWIVVSGGGFTDSARVYNLAATDPPCTGITAMADLAVGEVKTTGFVDNGICVPAATGEREYALVPFFDSSVPSAQTVFTVAGVGVKATQSAVLGALRARETLTAQAQPVAAAEARAALDRRLRVAERREMASRAADARRWYSSREAVASRRATRAIVVPAVGDEIQLNVNAVDFCASPSMRTGRVVAVTSKAVVVADKANPAGLSDAEYASLGATFDALAFAVNVENFGPPTDIDENGDRVILFFTHAVNELGPGTLGFAYSRDLLPKSGPLGSCPGSNVAELINIYVPDATTTVAEVKANAVATMGHELQHVINAARRLYINSQAAPVEERWLNEGLSHIAEELLFYRSTLLAPRQNIGAQASQAQYQAEFLQFQRQNFNRYFRFTRMPGAQGPIGVNDDDDDIETRGAIWSFLRFAADQRYAGNEATFWQSLVNANSTGIQNLYEHVGADTRELIRNWAMSNFLDDLVPTDSKYTQPSWNLRGVPGFQSPAVFNLLNTSQTAPTTTSATVTLRALSSEFVRFGVGANQEAYVSATGFPANTNTPLPRNVLLAIVRTK
jgi:hypothetical protein